MKDVSRDYLLWHIGKQVGASFFLSLVIERDYSNCCSGANGIIDLFCSTVLVL